jgi:Tfp pilus assembly protein PilV
MNRKGIILMEAIITTVIMAIGLTVIMQSLLSSYRSVSLQKEYAQALMIVENHLSKFLFDAKEAAPEDLNQSSSRFQYQGKVAISDSYLKKVFVSVKWPSGHNQRQLQVASLAYSSKDKISDEP